MEALEKALQTVQEEVPKLRTEADKLRAEAAKREEDLQAAAKREEELLADIQKLQEAAKREREREEEESAMANALNQGVRIIREFDIKEGKPEPDFECFCVALRDIKHAVFLDKLGGLFEELGRCAKRARNS